MMKTNTLCAAEAAKYSQAEQKHISPQNLLFLIVFFMVKVKPAVQMTLNNSQLYTNPVS